LAAARGDSQVVKQLVEDPKVVDVDAEIHAASYLKEPITALLQAVRTKQWEVATDLVSQGADVNFKFHDTYPTHPVSPLYLAIDEVICHYKWEKYPYDGKNDYETPLALVKQMVKHGGDLDLPYTYMPALVMAAVSGCKPLVDYFLEAGVDPR
jgi:hypothetical protein